MQVEVEPPFLIVKPGLTEEDFYRLAGEDTDWEYLDGREWLWQDPLPSTLACLRRILG